MRYLKLFEIFKPTFSKTDECEYEFMISDVPYIVKFLQKNEKTYEIMYGVLNPNRLNVHFDQVNKGDIYKVISTVVECSKDFIDSNPNVDRLEFQGLRDKDPIFDFFSKIYGRNIFLDYLIVSIYDVFGRISKSTKRTHVFSRWAERESSKINWSAKSVGNKIVLTKDKPHNESKRWGRFDDSTLIDSISDVLLETEDNGLTSHIMDKEYIRSMDNIDKFDLCIEIDTDISDGFKFSTIKNEIYHIKSLCYDHGYSLEQIKIDGKTLSKEHVIMDDYWITLYIVIYFQKIQF